MQSTCRGLGHMDCPRRLGKALPESVGSIEHARPRDDRSAILHMMRTGARLAHRHRSALDGSEPLCRYRSGMRLATELIATLAIHSSQHRSFMNPLHGVVVVLFLLLLTPCSSATSSEDTGGAPVALERLPQ